MAVYKIPQDVEADDKFVGPLSFKQFIYGGITFVCLYLSFLSLTKGFPFAIILFLPIIVVSGFLAFPWGKEQSTEVWLAAKIRFLIKPRIRIWNQSGVKELVTVTAPPKLEKHQTNGLNQNEVSSRLTGLADLLDSRGWAVKNVEAGSSLPIFAGNDDDADERLVAFDVVPTTVADVEPASDILDINNNQTAIHFEEMIKNSEEKHRQDILSQIDATRTANPPPKHEGHHKPQHRADFSFLQNGGPDEAAVDALFNTEQPAADGFTTFQRSNVVAPASANAYVPPEPAPNVDPATEQALLEKIHHMHEAAPVQYGHLKTINPLDDPAHAFGGGAGQAQAQDNNQQATSQQASNDLQTWSPPQQSTPVYQPPHKAQNHTDQTVTHPVDPAIINLASNNDLNVATLARQASKQTDDGEVVISLR